MPDTGIYRSNTPIQHSYDICGTVLSRWQREAQAGWQITLPHAGSTVYIVQHNNRHRTHSLLSSLSRSPPAPPQAPSSTRSGASPCSTRRSCPASARGRSSTSRRCARWRCCTALPAGHAATCQDTHAHTVRHQVGRRKGQAETRNAKAGVVNARLGRFASASVRVACDERQVARVAFLAMRHRSVCASTRSNFRPGRAG